MKKWDVYATVIGSKYLGQYEADSKEEAEEKALKDAHVSLCHQCDSECESPEVEDVRADEVSSDEQNPKK